MSNRLTKIYTRTGDDGSTGMADGSRVPKDDQVLQAIGDIDELNSQLAVVVCHLSGEFQSAVRSVQNRLFDVGGELSLSQPMINPQDVSSLEMALDELNKNLTPLKEFILPGGGLAASQCHVARSICRRAERSLVSLNRVKPLNDDLMAYINRLSDYLFVLARAISKEEGESETYWQSGKMKT